MNAPTAATLASDDRTLDEHIHDFIARARKSGTSHERAVADALEDRQLRAEYWEKEAREAREIIAAARGLVSLP